MRAQLANERGSVDSLCLTAAKRGKVVILINGKLRIVSAPR